MKKLMSIFGAFFFTALVLTSCGEVNVKDLDKDIENEDDAVEAYLTLFEARLQLMESLKGPLEEIAALKDRVEELDKAGDDLQEKCIEEELDFDDIEEDNEMEDLMKEGEDLSEELEKLLEDVEEVLETVL